MYVVIDEQKQLYKLKHNVLTAATSDFTGVPETLVKSVAAEGKQLEAQ